MRVAKTTTEGLQHSWVVAAEWTDLLTVFQTLEGGWVFRGQERRWSLEPTLKRYAAGMKYVDAEDVTVANAKRRIHHYLTAEHTPTNTLEWMALIQHYGGPSRLLDWTESPYVATFFALENATEPNGSCALWAVNTEWCRIGAVNAIRSGLVLTKEVATKFVLTTSLLSDVNFNQLTRSHVKAVVPVEPYKLNERLVVQQGTFLCPLDLSASFLKNLAAGRRDGTPHVFRIDIPNSLRAIGLERLRRMNISRATLFPGLDGFVQSLRHVVVREGSTDREQRVLLEQMSDPAIKTALAQTIPVGSATLRFEVPQATVAITSRKGKNTSDSVKPQK